MARLYNDNCLEIGKPELGVRVKRNHNGSHNNTPARSAVIKLENPLKHVVNWPKQLQSSAGRVGDPVAVNVVDSALYPLQVFSLVCPCALNQSWFHPQAQLKCSAKQDVFTFHVETFGLPMTKLCTP